MHLGVPREFSTNCLTALFTPRDQVHSFLFTLVEIIVAMWIQTFLFDQQTFFLFLHFWKFYFHNFCKCWRVWWNVDSFWNEIELSFLVHIDFTLSMQISLFLHLHKFTVYQIIFFPLTRLVLHRTLTSLFKKLYNIRNSERFNFLAGLKSNFALRSLRRDQFLNLYRPWLKFNSVAICNNQFAIKTFHFNVSKKSIFILTKCNG